MWRVFQKSGDITSSRREHWIISLCILGFFCGSEVPGQCDSLTIKRVTNCPVELETCHSHIQHFYWIIGFPFMCLLSFSAPICSCFIHCILFYTVFLCHFRASSINSTGSRGGHWEKQEPSLVTSWIENAECYHHKVLLMLTLFLWLSWTGQQ